MSTDREIPVKENDDGCFIAGTIVNGQRIEKIGIQTGIKNVYEYEIAGRNLIATPNHPILTHRGFVNIDTLRYNDIIWKNKSLFTRVSGGLDILTLINGLIGITISVVKRLLEAKERDYIDLYGKKRTELFRKDFIFITLTAIPRIIYWSILSVFTALNTARTIGQKKSENGLKKILNKLSNLLPYGQRLQLASLGEEKLANQMLNIFQDINLNGIAISAEKNISVKNQKEDFAISTVVKKRYVGRVPIYNLKTKSGMYSANGIVVSNCDALRYFVGSFQARNYNQYREPIEIKTNTFTGYGSRN